MGCITGGIIGTALTVCYKTIVSVINLALNVIAKLIFVFGFSVPFFYLIYGLFLFMFGVNVFDFTTYESRLYLIGLLASLVCTAIIIVRNCIGVPLRKLLTFKRYLKYKGKDSDYNPEKPQVYRSARHPDFVIHEYFDRYEIYSDRYGGPPTYLRTDMKTAAERRKSRKRK